MAAAPASASMPPPAAPGAVGTNALGVDATNLFTRGAEVPQNRGESMVQKHERLRQQATEKLALEKLTALMPMFAMPTCVAALKEVKWDVEQAAALLRQFQLDHQAELKTISKVRSAWVTCVHCATRNTVSPVRHEPADRK